MYVHMPRSVLGTSISLFCSGMWTYLGTFNWYLHVPTRGNNSLDHSSSIMFNKIIRKHMKHTITYFNPVSTPPKSTGLKITLIKSHREYF